MSMPTVPPGISPEFCRYLTMSKQEMVLADGRVGFMAQGGAAYIDADVPLPVLPDDLSTANALIETFLVGADASCTPLGTNQQLIDTFAACVEQMAEAVLASLASFGVEVSGPAYLTASVTASSDINGLAHFDDEQYHPDEGVGFVAIVGDVGGSRVANEAIAHSPVHAGVPVVFDQKGADDFNDGALSMHEAEPNKLVIFPQFGQLHAGPPLASAGLQGVRRLMVMRALTKPINVVAEVASAPRRRTRT